MYLFYDEGLCDHAKNKIIVPTDDRKFKTELDVLSDLLTLNSYTLSFGEPIRKQELRVREVD